MRRRFATDMKFRDLLLAASLPDDCTRALNRQVNPVLRHISCDSRSARGDSVFVCIKGALTDGHLYARVAYDHGCRAFVAEHPLALPPDAAVLITSSPRRALAVLSDRLYYSPSRRLKVIGITGTKGKTTTALMIKEILCGCGIPTGYIGSNGVEYGALRHSTINTTPESCDLQRYFDEMLRCGMEYVALEVSSQALYLDRVREVVFDTCVFTNLSPDHIGGAEHPDFDHYKACKASLFSQYSPRLAVVNADDPHTSDMLAGRKDGATLCFGRGESADFRAANIILGRTQGSLGVSFDYVRGGACIPSSLKLPGDFNVLNALAATAVCSDIVGNDRRILGILSGVAVAGRFEPVDALPYASVIIDYAHNGISMRSVLETLRAYNPRRLITLFGSVGGRTQLRRAELGAVASELSDFCILTADNPDGEHPMLIIRDIAAAFVPGGCDYVAIADRREAIRYAINMLREGDILLLAGKGHENYQLLKGVKTHFCERDIVLEAAAEIRAAMV